MSDRSFLKDGNIYDLMVNWNKRLANEQPFIQKLITDKTETILDVACGTGKHSIELAKKGYIVTGIDIDQTMINVARSQSNEVNFLQCDLMDENIDIGKYYDVVFSLGNSVALIASEYGYRAVLHKLSTLLNDEGILIFQILNTEKERNSWSGPRKAITDNGEFIFIRKFTSTEKYLQPEIITLFRSREEEEWQMNIQGPVNIPRINHGKLMDILESENLSQVNLYGDYSFSEFDPVNSVDMIFVARK